MIRRWRHPTSAVRRGRREPGLAAAVLIIAGLCAGLGIGPGCRRAPAGRAPDIGLSWTLAPDPPAMGPALVRLTLTDPGGRPIGGAHLAVEGSMAHPGMAPVFATVEAQGDGQYQARLTFTMGGDWFLLVSGDLPGGQKLDRRIDVANVRSTR